MLDRKTPATPATRARRMWRDTRRLIRRYQRWLGAALIGLALMLALTVLAPPPAPTASMTVAARDLPAGTVLAEEDLRDVRAPAELLPPVALGRADAIGQVLLAPVAAGETITTARVSGSGLLLGMPAGTVALPVRLADPGAASLLRPGDRVDLLAAAPVQNQPATVQELGRNLLVLHSAGRATDSEAGFGESDDLLGGLVVVAVTADDAATIVGGASGGALWAILRRPE